nr:hypothetical protein [Tanacetum cinerariifolium]
MYKIEIQLEIHDPLPSGQDRLQLNKLMEICTKLFDVVLFLEQIKTNQAAKIEKLKKRVKKLEGKKKKTYGLKRLCKVGFSARIISSDEEDQERMNDEELFGVNDLDGDEVIVDVTAGENVEQDATVVEKDVSASADEVVTTVESVKGITTATTSQISKDDVTLAQTLIEIKAAKPRDRGAKNKDKGIMVEPEKPLKKKDQIAFNEEVARKLDAQMKAKIEEEERIAREKDEANRAVIEEWDDVQASIDADRQLVEQLQAQEREQLSIEERSKLLDNLIESKRKYFAAKRAEEIRNKLPTKIVPKDDDDVIIKETPLSSKSPIIVDYKIYKEEKKSYFKIIRADGNSQNYLTFGAMLKNFNGEDLEVLRSIVNERFKKTKPVNDMDNLLFKTLKTMFEHLVEDNIWKYQQGTVKVYN